MPNLSAQIRRSHNANSIGFVLTGGFSKSSSTPIADLSAGRGDQLISVTIQKGSFLSHTAGVAGDASTPVGSDAIAGGISASRGDIVNSAVVYGCAVTHVDISNASLAVSANRLVIADATGTNRTMQVDWSVGAFGGRNIPIASASISATRLKISDIATDGHKIMAIWWKGMQP